MSLSVDCQMKKKLKLTTENEQEEDRISRLPDELLHQILKFVDTKLGVQTSVLSKRWKFVWTTLPFIKFRWDQFRFDETSCSSKNTTNLARHVLKHRNHRSQISYLELAFLPDGLFAKFVDYAIAHNVQHLNVYFREKHKPYRLANFNSNSIQKLEMRMELDDSLLESDCWDLPALTSLSLRGYLINLQKDKLPEICVTCLPALRILSLEEWDLKYFSFSLPALTSLSIWCCNLPQTIWDFPSLKSLELSDVEFPDNISDILAALVSLQNLTLYLRGRSMKEFFIDCPSLINLEIHTGYNYSSKGNIVVSAPNIRNFTSVGLFTITFGVSKLDTVKIKLKRWIDGRKYQWEELKHYYKRFKFMLLGLASAKILKLELETIKALNLISDFLGRSSPFYNLKYVKLPHGCNESSISTSLRSYLLGASPKATIVTTLPRDELIPQRLPVCLTTQKLLPKDLLATPVADWASSSKGGSDLGLWQGYEVNYEFIGLLDCIAKKYPETFDYFTTNSKELCTLKLNMLCATVKAFTNTSMTKIDAEMFAEYRALFADLQRSFNVNWLAACLNYIEQLKYSKPLLDKFQAVDSLISDAKSKLQDLHAL